MLRGAVLLVIGFAFGAIWILAFRPPCSLPERGSVEANYYDGVLNEVVEPADLN